MDRPAYDERDAPGALFVTQNTAPLASGICIAPARPHSEVKDAQFDAMPNRWSLLSSRCVVSNARSSAHPKFGEFNLTRYVH